MIRGGVKTLKRLLVLDEQTKPIGNMCTLNTTEKNKNNIKKKNEKKKYDNLSIKYDESLTI